MITLAIETSTPRGSVALHDGRALLFEGGFVAERGHGALLFPLLQAALKIIPHPAQIAVGLGPGSYAGVRIAIASAMGLELALGSSLAGLPSVAALTGTPESFVAVGDARRETYYWTEVVKGVCQDGPRLLTAAELHPRLARTTWPIYSSERMPFLPLALLAFPTAARLAEIAAAGLGVVQTGLLEPIYLREPHITKPAVPTGSALVRNRVDSGLRPTEGAPP